MYYHKIAHYLVYSVKFQLKTMNNLPQFQLTSYLNLDFLIYTINIKCNTSPSWQESN